MPERETHLLPEQELVNNSIIITSVNEALKLGLKGGDVNLLCEEVSWSIDEYNHEAKSLEMLHKEPDVIFNQLSKGLSCLIAAKDNDGWRMLYHGSIYPVFEQGEERILGTQIVEFGSSITQKNFRQNEQGKSFGLGSIGTRTRLAMMRNLFTSPGIELFGMSTVKRLKTGYVWGKKEFDIRPLSFWKHPYTSYLTNTCEAYSERSPYNHEYCGVRRSIEDSSDETLRTLFTKKPEENTHLPCTLIATDHDVVERFEDKCQNFHRKLGGIPLTENDISVASYKRADEFFAKVAEISGAKN